MYHEWYRDNVIITAVTEAALQNHPKGVDIASSRKVMGMYMKRMCIPNDFTVAQSERILRNYMDAHPEKWGDGMRSLFDAAYAQAFPCK